MKPSICCVNALILAAFNHHAHRNLESSTRPPPSLPHIGCCHRLTGHNPSKVLPPRRSTMQSTCAISRLEGQGYTPRENLRKERGPFDRCFQEGKQCPKTSSSSTQRMGKAFAIAPQPMHDSGRAVLTVASFPSEPTDRP